MARSKFKVGDLVSSKALKFNRQMGQAYYTIWKVKSCVAIRNLGTKREIIQYCLVEYGQYPIENDGQFLLTYSGSSIGWVNQSELKRVPKKVQGIIALSLLSKE